MYGAGKHRRHRSIVYVFRVFSLVFSASRPIITDVDLKGHTVLTIKRGVSESCDRMCDDLMKAGIAIEEVEIYSTSVLIECMENDKPVIIPDCWSNIHPHSKTVSFIREYKCPYGFFLSKTASNAAKMFIRYIEQWHLQGSPPPLMAVWEP